MEALYSCARFVVGIVRRLGLLTEPPVELTPTQKDRLTNIWDQIRVPFDGELEEHEMALRRLWSLAFPDIELPSMKTKLWKDMGWQGEYPGTDFRAAGFVSLQNLITLAEEHPDIFAALLHKSNGVRSEWEYPFAVGGLNITFMLQELLQLRKEPDPPDSPTGRGFLVLLANEETAFDWVYAAAFELLDKVWIEQKATYMEFPVVMAATKKSIEEALAENNFNSGVEFLEYIRTTYPKPSSS